MDFLSQPDLMQYKFVYSMVEPIAGKITFLTNFHLGVELVRDVVFSLERYISG